MNVIELQKVCSLTQNVGSEFLAAFLGFLSALMVADLIDKGKKKQAIINLGIELLDIEAQLTKYQSNSDVPPVLAHSLYFPIWNSLLYTGQILDLRNEEYYLTVISIYSHLQKLKEQEDWLCDNYRNLGSEEINTSIKKIIALRHDVCGLLKSDCINDIRAAVRKRHDSN